MVFAGPMPPDPPAVAGASVPGSRDERDAEAAAAGAAPPVDAGSSTSSDHRIRFVTLPAAAGPVAGATTVLVAGTDAAASVRPPVTPDGEAADGATLPLDVAVAAAHDARIRALRERADLLRSQGAGAAVLAGLRDRLQRAEAARQVALGRIGDSACSDGRCGPPPARLARSDPFSKRHPPSIRRSASTRGVSASVSVGASPLPRMTPMHARFGQVAHIAVAGRPPLVRARRSLANARRLLHDARPATRATATILLTALWHWTGSEVWTLTPDRPRGST